MRSRHEGEFGSESVDDGGQWWTMVDRNGTFQRDMEFCRHQTRDAGFPRWHVSVAQVEQMAARPELEME